MCTMDISGTHTHTHTLLSHANFSYLELCIIIERKKFEKSFSTADISSPYTVALSLYEADKDTFTPRVRERIHPCLRSWKLVLNQTTLHILNDCTGSKS